MTRVIWSCCRKIDSVILHLLKSILHCSELRKNLQLELLSRRDSTLRAKYLELKISRFSSHLPEKFKTFSARIVSMFSSSYRMVKVFDPGACTPPKLLKVATVCAGRLDLETWPSQEGKGRKCQQKVLSSGTKPPTLHIANHTNSFREVTRAAVGEMSAIKVYEDLCYNEIEMVRFVWKIRDFSLRTSYVRSHIFPSSAPAYIGKWQLILQTSRRKNSEIKIDIKQIDHNVDFAKIMFCLINDKESVVVSQDTEYIEPVCTVHLTSRDFILNKENGLLPNNELTIVCKIEIIRPPVISSPTKFEPPPCQLAKDLGNLLSSMSLSDVTIAVGGEEFRAHKAVLAARSAVFADMFSNEMLEKETSVVEIANMDAEVFGAMLEFMYTGEVNLQTCEAKDFLLAAATIYELQRLKSMCEEALCKTLSPNNVLLNLFLADLHNAPRLKEQCIQFVIKHRAKVLKRLSWDFFIRNYHSLVTEIIKEGF